MIALFEFVPPSLTVILFLLVVNNLLAIKPVVEQVKKQTSFFTCFYSFLFSFLHLKSFLLLSFNGVIAISNTLVNISVK